MFYLATTSLIVVWCTLEVASHKPQYISHPDFIRNGQIINGIDDGLQTNCNDHQQADYHQGQEPSDGNCYEFVYSTKDHIRCEKCDEKGHINGRLFMKDKGMIVKYQASKADGESHDQHISAPEQSRPTYVAPSLIFAQNQPAIYQPPNTQPTSILPPDQRLSYPMAQTLQPANQIYSIQNPTNTYAHLAKYALPPGPISSQQDLQLQANPVVSRPLNELQQFMGLPTSNNLANFRQFSAAGAPNIPVMSGYQPQLAQPTQMPQRLITQPQESDSQQFRLLSAFQSAVNDATASAEPQVEQAGNANGNLARYMSANGNSPSNVGTNYVPMVQAENGNGSPLGGLRGYSFVNGNNPNNVAGQYGSMVPQAAPAANVNMNQLGALARLVNGIDNDPRAAPNNYVSMVPQAAPAGNVNGDQLAALARYLMVNGNNIGKNVPSQIQQPPLLSSQPLKQNPDGSYSFGFKAYDHSRFEAADHQNNVMGGYSFVTPDGNTHKINYIAGAGKGFVPEIHPPVPAGVSNSANQVNEGRSDQLALPSVNGVQAMPRFGGVSAMPIIVMTSPQPSAKASTLEGKSVETKDTENEKEHLMEELAQRIAKYVKSSDDDDDDDDSAAPTAVQPPAPLK